MGVLRVREGSQWKDVGSGGGLDQTTADARYAPSSLSTSIFNVLDYEADPTRSVDSTVAFQNTLNAADAGGYGATVLIPSGRYIISDTLTWPIGVRILGQYGSGDGAGAFASNPPMLLWRGATAKNVIMAEDNGGTFGTTWYWMENLYVMVDTGFRCQSVLVFPSRLDLGSRLRNVALTGTVNQGASSGTIEQYAVEFRKGGINVHLQDFRCDAFAKHAFFWKIGTGAGSIDSLSLDKFTIDGKCDALGKSGGTLHLDATTASASHRLELSVSRAKLETNLNMDVGEAHFRFDINPALTGLEPQVIADFTHVWETPGAGVTRHDGVRVNPSSDAIQLISLNSNLSVVGVPSYNGSQSLIGTNQKHVDTVVAPRSPNLGQAPAASNQMARETVGDTNVLGQTNVFGKKASSIIHAAATDAALSGVTLYAGDMLIDPATRNAGARILREVTTKGTLGTLAGVTGSLTSGTAALTVNDVNALRVGQVITLGGVDSRSIVAINASTLLVTLSSNVGNTYTGAAITWAPPAFRDLTIDAMEIYTAAWTPSTIASGATARVFISMPSAGVDGGDLAIANFSVQLPAGVFQSYQQSTNGGYFLIANLSGASQTIGAGTVTVRVMRTP